MCAVQQTVQEPQRSMEFGVFTDYLDLSYIMYLLMTTFAFMHALRHLLVFVPLFLELVLYFSLFLISYIC